jgi:hypothetical protein
VVASEAEKPAADFSARGPRGSNRLGNQIATEAISDKAKNQDGATGEMAAGLRPGEISAARRAYALHRAYPWLRTVDIATRLASDHGLYGRRWKPYRCKRLRRMIDAYAQCVHAGVEPAPETIFADEEAT